MALHVNQPAEEATHGDSTVCASEASGLVATANPQATSMHPCVAVIGMGRSGTSATAGLLVSLGLTGPSGDDLLPATSSNERGHWESIAVIACNSRLLRAVGATTTGPPPVTLEWDDVPDHAARLAEAEEWYRDTYTGAPIVVKDPRMCLTLSFWRKALPQPLAALCFARSTQCCSLLTGSRWTADVSWPCALGPVCAFGFSGFGWHADSRDQV